MMAQMFVTMQDFLNLHIDYVSWTDEYLLNLLTKNLHSIRTVVSFCSLSSLFFYIHSYSYIVIFFS